MPRPTIKTETTIKKVVLWGEARILDCAQCPFYAITPALDMARSIARVECTYKSIVIKYTPGTWLQHEVDTRPTFLSKHCFFMQEEANGTQS